ncbi:MAG TPA: 5'-3' exonuclease H3TH domain-containing protein, partial [Candidatus Limnocylindria bacterium]
RGVSELAEVDEAWITKKYGIPGDRYLDYALMRGDPSDGLPGVAGIGEKTASDVLRRYGSLDAAIAAPDLSPTIRQKLKASAPYLEAARRVVAPVSDTPVRGGDGAIPTVPRDPERARALGERYRLTGAVDRLIAALPSVP